MNGLAWQTVRVPLGRGMNQKLDARSLAPPELARLVDAQFDELDGLQTRFPYGPEFGAILGGGSISDARRLVAYGNELLLFTKDTLYSWNAQLSKWASKGTHLAVKVEEENRFVSGGDQLDCDRGELDGTVVYAWTELLAGLQTVGYVAAVDEATGSVLMAPTAIPTVGQASRLRVTPLQTKILVSYKDSLGGIYAYALDPASPATGIASVTSNRTLSDTGLEDYYDIVAVPGVDQAVFAARRSPTSSYALGTVTAGLVVSRTTKARTCTRAIAVSCPPTGTHVQVIRDNFGAVEGDYIALSGFADVYTAQALGGAGAGTADSVIAAAHRSTTDGGAYRCYVIWSFNRSTDGVGPYYTSVNWVDTSGALGTSSVLIQRAAAASRAFDRDGRIYVWLVHAGAIGSYGFGGNIENGLFLYRDDGALVAKSTWNRAAGFSSDGYLPSVQDLGDGAFGYCATERALFTSKTLAISGNAFSGRRPRDVTFTFDSNEARRCVRLGRTLYIAGGELLQYDGIALTEVGFHVWPWYWSVGIVGGAGSLADGDYGYKLSLRSDNAQAERDRSAAPFVQTLEMVGGPHKAAIGDTVPLFITHKSAIATEVWRTEVNPTEEDPYYLSTSSDPGDGTNPNRYLANDTSATALPDFEDDLDDDELTQQPQFPQDVTLPSLAPPACSIICASDTRLFLAGVAGEPNNVWYSKQRAEGEIAAFHGALIASVPREGGAITALGFLSETLVAFCASAIYVLPGDGYDNAGGGTNYGPARAISLDIGAVNHESVALTDRGLIFKSRKGWYLLNKGWSLEYIGGPVSDYDDETPLAVQVVESQHQVRILTSSRMLVLDTLASELLQRPTWAEWSVTAGVHACMWRGSHVYLTDTGARQQLTTYTGVDYAMDVELAFVRPADIAGQVVIRKLYVLGEVRSACDLRVRLARDDWKDGVDTYFQDKAWTVSPATAGAPLRLKHGPSIKRMSAIKVRLTAQAVGSTDAPDGEAVKLTAIAIEFGVEAGFNHRLPATQKN